MLTWPQGTLLVSTNVTGPWVTKQCRFTVHRAPTNARMFYRLQLSGNPISINFSGSGTLMGSSEKRGCGGRDQLEQRDYSSGSGLLLNDSAGKPRRGDGHLVGQWGL